MNNELIPVEIARKSGFRENLISLSIVSLTIMHLIGTVILLFSPTHAGLLSVLASALLAVAVLYISHYGLRLLNYEKQKQLLLCPKISIILFSVNLLFFPLLRLYSATKSPALLFLGAIVICLIVAVGYSAGIGQLNSLLSTSFISTTYDLPVLQPVNPGDIILCKVKEKVEEGSSDPREILPFKDRFLHMLIIGPTGSGKTSQILLPMIYQDLQNPYAGVIVMEPKSDLTKQVYNLAKRLGRPVKYFDPSVDICPHFNPLIGSEMDVLETLTNTFRMMQAGSSQYFLDMTDQLVRNSVKVLKRLDEYSNQNGKYANFITFSRLVQNPGGDGRALIDLFTKLTVRNAQLTDQQKNENEEIAEYFKTDYYAERSKTYENTSAVRSQLTKLCSNEFLRDILNPNEKNDIDFSQALENGEVICISTAQGDLGDLSEFLGFFLILQLQAAVFHRPGNEDTRRPCFLYIDEFQTYANPGFSNLLTQGRSYRVATHLATQSRSSMGMGSGHDGNRFVELVSTNARNVVVFPGANNEDANYFSKQFGEHYVTEVSKSYSQKRPTSWDDVLLGGSGSVTESIHESTQLKCNFTPTDIMQQPFGQVVYQIVKNSEPQLAKYGLLEFLPVTGNADFKQEIADFFNAHKRKPKEVRFTNPVPKDETKEEEKPATVIASGDASVLWNRLEEAALEQKQAKKLSDADESWFN